MKRLLPAAIMAFLVLPQAAQAQYDQEQLGKVEEINVSVRGSVKGGCVPSPNVLKVEAELILRRFGITVTDRKFGPVLYTLGISLAGFAVADVGGCVGSVHVELWRSELLDDQTRGSVEVAQLQSVFWGPKADFQEQLRTDVNRVTTALANEILKARPTGTSS